MSSVTFNKDGNPDVFIGSKAIINFVNPEEVPDKKTGSTAEETEAEEIGKFKIMPWYDNNDFPVAAHKLIDSTPILKRALISLTKMMAGQGVYPTKVIEYKADGSEKLEIINDPEISKLLRNNIIRNYLARCGYDIYALQNAFVKLIPDLGGSKLLRIEPMNAKHCRLGEADSKTGKINNVLVLGNWEDADEKAIKSYTLLDYDNPDAHLEELKTSGVLKKAPVVMHLKGDFSGNDYYSLPPWYSAKKWIDIAGKVATMVDAGMDNMLNLFIHLQIPYSYWEKKYKIDDFENQVERQKKIQADIEKIEEKLTSSENAKKTLITHFGDSDAEGEDGWKIEVIDRKFSQENLMTSSAADTQTAIAAGVNPDLLGLMYGNSKGGSMQRELLLIQYALSWLDRQKLADPLEIMIRFNNPKHEDIELRFRNTFLTALDSGQETQTELS